MLEDRRKNRSIRSTGKTYQKNREEFPGFPPKTKRSEQEPNFSLIGRTPLALLHKERRIRIQ
jgi:hypothetical protein